MERNIETKELRGIQPKHIIMLVMALVSMTATVVGWMMKVDSRLARMEEKMIGVDVLQKQVSQIQVGQDMQQLQLNELKRRFDEADNRKQKEEDMVRNNKRFR